MKTSSKFVLGFYVLFASFSLKAEVVYNATFVTDYLFEGITQTDNKPALQLAADYTHGSGFYAGAWGSNVDFGGDASGIELDLYFGFTGSMTDKLDFDLGYVDYKYLNDDNNALDASEYSEFYAKLTFMKNTKLSLWVDDDKDLWGGSSTRIKIEHSLVLPNDYNLNLALHNWRTDFRLWDNDDNALTGKNSYLAYTLGISKEFSQYLFALNLTGTNIDDLETAETKLFLSVSKSF
jgi:uncharacterized protein (TIGR02001 family)